MVDCFVYKWEPRSQPEPHGTQSRKEVNWKELESRFKQESWSQLGAATAKKNRRTPFSVVFRNNIDMVFDEEHVPAEAEGTDLQQETVAGSTSLELDLVITGHLEPH